MAFGQSLHIDLYGIDEALCDDLTFNYNLLEDLASFLDMHKQSPPFIFRSPDEYPEKAGLSGWVPLIESGISIHTLTPQNFITIDLYTCGELNIPRTLQFLEERLRPSHYEYQYLLRGLVYGETVAAGESAESRA
jgi:S-adenosylmethionine/arginine decarboxylase-like enzyme